MVAKGTWTRYRLGIDRDPRPATDEEYAEWQARKAAREMQTQLEHAEHLAAKHAVTQEQINEAYKKLWGRFAAGEFDQPLPFTARCPTSLVDVDDLEDLHETQKDAIT